ncbi:MAG: restriction endonuclease [Candidatus Aminicenantes bacterium]|nr:restriction endonuclease [Candidatus Aminicenantes bacterium]
MAIPDYQSIMLPLLKFAGDQKEHSMREAVEALAAEFKLSDEERKELLPSGQQAVFDNRVGWARTYMKKAGLLESQRRGYFQIMERGLDVLKENPSEINVKYLEQFPEFIEFRNLRKEKEEEKIEDTKATPEETIESAYLQLRDELASELLEHVKNMSPSFFERLVVDLLVKMGYGGTRKDAGEAFQKSRDEGIDGIIREDRLGLDVIYVQAKRWENPVGRPEIQKFAGALQGQRAKKGIFITTSQFSKDAEEFVKKIDSKIVLIDGESLARFMIDHNIGVSPSSAYEIKRIDMDYFTGN